MYARPWKSPSGSGQSWVAEEKVIGDHEIAIAPSQIL